MTQLRIRTCDKCGKEQSWDYEPPDSSVGVFGGWFHLNGEVVELEEGECQCVLTPDEELEIGRDFAEADAERWAEPY